MRNVQLVKYYFDCLMVKSDCFSSAREMERGSDKKGRSLFKPLGERWGR